jgi:hypothetical protein
MELGDEPAKAGFVENLRVKITRYVTLSHFIFIYIYIYRGSNFLSLESVGRRFFSKRSNVSRIKFVRVFRDFFFGSHSYACRNTSLVSNIYS